MDLPYQEMGADIYMAGHDHAYERIVSPSGFTYIINGVGGRSFYNYGSRDPNSVFSQNTAFGAMLAEVDARTARFEFRSINDGASGLNGGVVLDSFEMEKPVAVSVGGIAFQASAGDRFTQSVWTEAAAGLHPAFSVPNANLRITDAGGNAVVAALVTRGEPTEFRWIAPADGEYLVTVEALNNPDSGKFLLQTETEPGTVTSYADWAAAAFGAEAASPDAEPGADFYRAGFPNAIRFATGAGAGEPMPLWIENNGSGRFLVFSIDTAAAGSVVAELSGELGEWRAAEGNTEVTAQVGTRYWLRVALPEDAGAHFARLRAVLPDAP